MGQAVGAAISLTLPLPPTFFPNPTPSPDPDPDPNPNLTLTLILTLPLTQPGRGWRPGAASNGACGEGTALATSHPSSGQSTPSNATPTDSPKGSRAAPGSLGSGGGVGVGVGVEFASHSP